MILSPCCKATCYIDYGDGGAHWYACSACGQPCDPQPERDGDANDDSCKDTRAKGGEK